MLKTSRGLERNIKAELRFVDTRSLMCWRVPLQLFVRQGRARSSGHAPSTFHTHSSILCCLSDPCADHRAIWHAVRGRLLPLPVPLSPRLPHSPSTCQADYHRTQHCPLQPQLLQKRQSLPEHSGVSGGSFLSRSLVETLALITFQLTNNTFWIVVEHGQVQHGVLLRASHLSSSPSSLWWQRTHTIMNQASSRYGCDTFHLQATLLAKFAKEESHKTQSNQNNTVCLFMSLKIPKGNYCDFRPHPSHHLAFQSVRPVYTDIKLLIGGNLETSHSSSWRKCMWSTIELLMQTDSVQKSSAFLSVVLSCHFLPNRRPYSSTWLFKLAFVLI